MKAAAIVLSGGFGGRGSHVAETTVYWMENKQWMFMHLYKGARWFLSGCGGPSVHRGELHNAHVIDLLRERFQSGETAVAEEAPAVADPMNDLDDVLEEKPIETKKPKINRKKFNMNIPVCLTMPKRPPCAGVEQDEVVNVHVLVHSGGHRAMFLRMDSIDWLLAYAADEQHYQGIPRAPPPERPAVADEPYTISWDFDDDVWVAVILSGDEQGATKCFRTEALHKSKWNSLLQDPSAAQWLDAKDTRWSKSCFRSRRAATKELARLWCVATLQGEREKFEKSELFNPTAKSRSPEVAMLWSGRAAMQDPIARSRSPHSACSTTESESAVAASEPRKAVPSSQTVLHGFFESAVAVKTVKREHTAVAETIVKAEPRERPTCKPAVAVPQPTIAVYSSDDE